MHDPFIKFKELFKQYNQFGKMAITTVGKNNKPTLRNIALKHYDENGFIFATKRNTIKVKNLSENPNIAALFDWFNKKHQVRIEGVAIEASEDEMRKNFASRPREKQIKAWAFNQFDKIEDIKELDEKILFFTNKFKDHDVIPYINYWITYTIIPNYFEFWGRLDSGECKREHYSLKNNIWSLDIYYEK